jgi:hypothetical protein
MVPRTTTLIEPAGAGSRLLRSRRFGQLCISSSDRDTPWGYDSDRVGASGGDVRWLTLQLR